MAAALWIIFALLALPTSVPAESPASAPSPKERRPSILFCGAKKIHDEFGWKTYVPRYLEHLDLLDLLDSRQGCISPDHASVGGAACAGQ